MKQASVSSTRYRRGREGSGTPAAGARDAFLGIPASLIKDILDRARALQEQLIKSGQVTPELKRSEAAALLETATSLLAIADTAGALAAAEQARQIMADLVASNPESTDFQRELSVAYDNIGDVQVAQGDLAGALKSYRDGLAIAERLAQSDPGNASWRRDLSVSYNKVGDVQVEQGDLAGALKSYRDSLAIRERPAQSDPGNAGWRSELSVSYNNVGDVQVAQGDLAGALKSYRDGLAIAERLAQSDPGNAGWQRDLSVSYEKVGDVQQRAAKGQVYEFRRRIGSERAFVLSGSCSPDGQQTAFLPFIEVVRGSFRVSAGEAEREIAQKLEVGLTAVDLNSVRNLGLLLHLLGLKVPGGALSGLDGVLIGLRTRELLQQLLEVRCRLSPVVMVMEDLHWIDSVSEEFRPTIHLSMR